PAVRTSSGPGPAVRGPRRRGVGPGAQHRGRARPVPDQVGPGRAGDDDGAGGLRPGAGRAAAAAGAAGPATHPRRGRGPGRRTGLGPGARDGPRAAQPGTHADAVGPTPGGVPPGVPGVLGVAGRAACPGTTGGGCTVSGCSTPGCTGSIVDGYCDVCGSPGAGGTTSAGMVAEVASARTSAPANATTPGTATSTPSA